MSDWQAVGSLDWPSLPSLVDTHVHLATAAFARDRDEVLQRARRMGLVAMVAIGSQPQEAEAAVALAQDEPDVWATVGVHPHHAARMQEAHWELIATLAKRDRVVALGEMGLDFHYDFAPRRQQEEVFARQLAWAQQVHLPVVLHERETQGRLLALLEAAGRLPAGGVWHCFNGTAAEAERALALGLHIGVGGMLTFAKAEELRAVVATVPLTRIVLETDAPYLAPTPYRGRRNEPALVSLVATRLAELHGLAPAEVAAVTSANAARLFGWADRS